MRLLAFVALVLGLLLVVGQTFAQDSIGSRQVLYHNGFEAGDEGMVRWWDNGEFVVNFAGISEEKAYNGKSSFKLDISFRTGTASYWKGTHFYIPLKGSPTVRGALLVEKGSARLGFGFYGGASGMCGSGGESKQLPSGWQEWESKNEPSLVDTDHLEWVAVYINSPAGENVVLYLDEFEVVGIPMPELSQRIEKQITTEADEARKASEESFRDGVQNLHRQFLQLQKQENTIPAQPLSGKVAPWLREIDNKLTAYYAKNIASAASDIENLSKAGSGDLQSVRKKLRYVGFAADSLRNMPGWVKTSGDRPYLIYNVPPIRNEKITPECFPVPGVVGTSLKVSACADEYAPVSFAVYAAQELKDVKVTASSFTSPKSRQGRPSPKADLFAVKCWWQAAEMLENGDPEKPVFTPELLLKDSGLVIVDDVTKRNRLRNPDGPRDARTLQPVTIPAGELQQFWVTVHIPKNTSAGVYKGNLNLTIAGAKGVTLPLTVTVLPFQLEPPMLEYGIFYENFLYDPIYYKNHNEDTKPYYDSLVRSPEQYLAEMKDLKAHGVDLPACEDDMLTTPDGKLDFSHIRRIWELRKKAGLTGSPIIKIRPGIPISEYAYTKDPARKRELLKEITDKTKQWMAFCKETGFPTPLIYGIDEAGGDLLAAERDAYKAVQEAGGMTGAAVGQTFFRLAGDSLSRPIIHRGTSEDELRMIHEAGNKAWVYGTPQGGREEPETYRRSYGLELWQRGYDGCTTWAYQWAFGKSMWDDFDSNFEIRDHMMTYPAVDGPISTIQWEGWREAHNDVRYLSTYLKLIEQGKSKTKTRQLALDGEKWLKEMDAGGGDLDAIRVEMVQKILSLSKALGK